MREISATGKIVNYVMLKDIQVNAIKMAQRKGQKAMKAKGHLFPHCFYAQTCFSPQHSLLRMLRTGLALFQSTLTRIKTILG